MPARSRDPTAALIAGEGTELKQLAVMGTSVKIIDRHYGHLVHDSEDTARAKLEAYASKG